MRPKTLSSFQNFKIKIKNQKPSVPREAAERGRDLKARKTTSNCVGLSDVKNRWIILMYGYLAFFWNWIRIVYVYTGYLTRSSVLQHDSASRSKYSHAKKLN
jgi:hypothetical protein